MLEGLEGLTAANVTSTCLRLIPAHTFPFGGAAYCLGSVYGIFAPLPRSQRASDDIWQGTGAIGSVASYERCVYYFTSSWYR